MLAIMQCLTLSHGKFHFPDTVSTLDPPSYVGRWYQTYGSTIPLVTYENNSYCITADYYDPLPGGVNGFSFSVTNTLK